MNRVGMAGCAALFLLASAADAITSAAIAAPASAAPVTAAAALGWIRDLAGDWQGTFEWTGGRTAKGTIDARYTLTGNGSAVVEDLLMDGKPTMTSVYHLDGDALRMTHYCGAGNQPRLKAASIDAAAKSIHFDLVDITNLKSPTAGHVVAVDLKSIDAAHLVVRFTFRGSGPDSLETIDLRRARS